MSKLKTFRLDFLLAYKNKVKVYKSEEKIQVSQCKLTECHESCQIVMNNHFYLSANNKT